MTRRVEVNGSAAEVSLSRADDEVRFRISGGAGPAAEGVASLKNLQPGVYSVLWEGRSYLATVARNSNGLTVHVGAHAFAVSVLDPREWQPADESAHGGSRQKIAAPMPGKVVRVLVEEGAQVEAGQGIVVVEAMKMQNELQALHPGRVASLKAVAGAAVAAGQVLAVIE